MTSDLSATRPPILSVRDLSSGYGGRQVLNGISFDVLPGETVAIVGHNGSGKSTLLKTVFGLISLYGGKVLVRGQELRRHAPRTSLQAGVAFVPQGFAVFPELSVQDNLRVSAEAGAGAEDLQDAIGSTLVLFPVLCAKLRHRARTLSTGEKQMLGLCTALVKRPQLILVDEPTLGLSEDLVGLVFDHLKHLSRESGIALVIVEHKVRDVLKLAKRVLVLRSGAVAFWGAVDGMNQGFVEHLES